MMKWKLGNRWLTSSIGTLGLLVGATFLLPILLVYAADNTLQVARLKPVVSSGTGLLLEPPVDLSGFTHEEFVRISSSVGPEKINKAWTSPVVPLPPHVGSTPSGLSEKEIKDYMRQAHRLFDTGKAVPVSDVGLVSTQEDVIRRPMFNHVSAFSNEVANVYLLVQKTVEGDGWGVFSIVQDLTVNPPINYFSEIKGSEVRLEAVSCYKCHVSGPLAIHPTREDLVNDPALLVAFNEHLVEQPIGRMYYPDHDPAPVYGEPMQLKFCGKCHADDGERAALYRDHSHSIRVLTDFGYMPPKRRLSPEEINELKVWLESKP